MAGPLDSIGKKLGPDENYREAQRQNGCVFQQESGSRLSIERPANASGANGPVENREASRGFLLTNILQRSISGSMQPNRQMMRIIIVAATDEREIVKRPDRRNGFRRLIEQAVGGSQVFD
jgi:hypothetical protein